MNVLDLFSGIGGFSLGLERAGMRTVAFCEIEPYCRAVLRKHWPGVPIFGDVRTLTAADVSGVDVICGGFPCQDISVAGKNAGITGERSGLWSEFARLIGEIRPRYAIVENVAALLGRGIGVVLGDLASLGFNAEWHCIPAGNLGAPHERDRVWIIAYASRPGLEGWRLSSRIQQEIPVNGCADAFANAEKIPWLHRIQHRNEITSVSGDSFRPAWCGNEWMEDEPILCRVDDGFPDRLGRIGACGNAVVPQIPEIIGRAIMQAEGLAT